MTKIYEGNRYILIRTGYSDPAVHRHMAAHVIISLQGKMRAYTENEVITCHGVMIPSGTAHRIDTQGNPALVFLFDCTSNVSSRITAVSTVPETMCGEIVSCYCRLEKQELNEAFSELENLILSYFGMVACEYHVTDERILKAMEYIRIMSPEKITCKEVADYTHLSQDRFSHLFKEKTGMTFASYVIYQRLMRVYANVFRGMSITEAALEAGFSGSSHFADVNRRVFGNPMRSIMENASFEKVS